MKPPKVYEGIVVVGYGYLNVHMMEVSGNLNIHYLIEKDALTIM